MDTQMAIAPEINKSIRDMKVGDFVEGFYILKDAAIKTTATGKSFLSGQISDRYGSTDIKVWDYSGPIGTDKADVGRVIKLRGEVSEYKGSKQISITNIRLAAAGDIYNPANLVPTAPIDADETMSEVDSIVDSIEDSDYRALAKEVLSRHRERFEKIPAAKSFHHAFLHGLLMHTSGMLRTADFLADQYREVIDRDLLLTGTLLHDIAKDTEFTISELGLVSEYSMKGQLLGHLVMGAQEVAETAARLGIPEEKSVLVQHLILSHHGEPEFGAAVIPCAAEAELLSFIDRIDSRMEIYAEQFENMDAGEFSARIPALDKKIYKHFD